MEQPALRQPKPLQPFSNTIVILNRPQDAGNIGAVVRAMKNMGFAELRLVQPEPFTNEELLRVAHRCEDLITRMARFENLDDALSDTDYVVGTAAIAHHKRPRTDDIRTLAQTLAKRTARGKVALLFGQEDDGLDNYALDRRHLIAMLPSNRDYPALNLAQSVLLFLHEIRMVAIDESMQPEELSEPLATQAELEQLFQLSEEVLTRIGFFRYNPDAVLRTLRQITYRATLRSDEAKLLQAILRKISNTQQNG
ncbi:MAG: hypothetical protein KDE31_36745 [Caldilineaceae bacterium]|nr:hypothetical protein [Caldilineaceae bacterium]